MNRKGIVDSKIILPELSYALTGLCFEAHNALGRFRPERSYGDFMEKRLGEMGMSYVREHALEKREHIVDFLIEGKIVLELKAKRLLEKQDFYQLQRYLQVSQVKLGLLVNFRNRYLKPVRVVRIDTDARQRFV